MRYFAYLVRRHDAKSSAHMLYNQTTLTIFAVKRILAYKNYFKDFYDTLSQKEKDKVDRILVLLQSEDRTPAHYIRYLTQGIYELRISVPNKELRFLFIYDGGQIILLLNCFAKKKQKTPQAEIEKAIRLKHEYHETKGRE